MLYSTFCLTFRIKIISLLQFRRQDGVRPSCTHFTERFSLKQNSTRLTLAGVRYPDPLVGITISSLDNVS